MPPLAAGYDIAEIERIHKDIQPTLIKRAQDWKRLQERVCNRIDDYKNDPVLASAIYRVYTREERQSHLGVGHPHMKEFFKIAEEIYAHRTGKPKVRAGAVKPTARKPAFQLYDVMDIIGVTIVCPSEDDVELIKARIQDDIDALFFTSEKLKQHDESLYRAFHFVVGIDEDPLGSLRCEIQIKTAIQDAFSWKTHSLAYKTNGKASPWETAQFESVMAVLRAADSIVESMAKRARDETDLNNQKRRHARLLLSEKLARDLETMRSHQHFDFFEHAIVELARQLPLSVSSRDGRSISEIKRKIDQIIAADDGIARFDKFFFRLIALCAIVNPRQDATFWLDELFARYLDHLRSAKTPDNETAWNHITVFSLAHYCRGGLAAACGVLEKALTIKELPKRVLATIRCDLAYYYAEAYSQKGIAQDRDAARRHHDKAQEVLGGDIPPRHGDSLGYVMIETGETIQEVRKGLDLCEEAIDLLLKGNTADEQSKKAGDYFLRLHREIAFRRIADMASADCAAALQPKPIS